MNEEDRQQVTVRHWVQTVLLSDIRVRRSGLELEPLQFRIDVYGSARGQFTCQLWRLETCVMVPAFRATRKVENFHGTIFVLDDGIQWQGLTDVTVSGLIDGLLGLMEVQLGIVIERPLAVPRP